jgi:hypothetical protein
VVKLRRKLANLNRLVLTGPAVQANARRASIDHASSHSLLSKEGSGGKRRLSALAFGLGTPHGRVHVSRSFSNNLDAIPSPKIGTIQNVYSVCYRSSRSWADDD